MRIWSKGVCLWWWRKGGAQCFERGVALRSYKNLSLLAAQYIQSMQQAAVAVPHDFRVNMRGNPWDFYSVVDWQQLPAAVCIQIMKVIDAMVQTDYAGPNAVVLPMPVAPVTAPVELPWPFYVVITRRGTASVWLNQFRVSLRDTDIRSRPVQTPRSVKDLYPNTDFSHGYMSESSLRTLFWGRLAEVWSLVGEDISLRPQPAMAKIKIEVDLEKRRLFHLARVALQAEIMQPHAKHATTVLIPADGSGNLFTALTRVGALAVNAVRIDRFGATRYPDGSTLMQSELPTVGLLQAAFPGWEFRFQRLADPELFRLIQLPVRASFQKEIQDTFAGPRLRMLARAFHRRVLAHPRAMANGFALGDVSTDVMARIVAFVVEDPEWGCP